MSLVNKAKLLGRLHSPNNVIELNLIESPQDPTILGAFSCYHLLNRLQTNTWRLLEWIRMVRRSFKMIIQP